jgi:acetolactate synthase-1/2/3 large subunit
VADITGGQALVRQLALEGVEQIFGIPGVQLDWAVDALIDAADRIAYWVPRHEQATSYMADGYARTTGKVGVCMVVPGPGVLNAMSGLATAYACSSPVVCIAGQINTAARGRGLGMLHEIPEQSRTLGTVTKWAALARAPGEIPTAVREAFHRARSGRHRPVAIEIPPDVLQATGAIQLVEPRAPETPAAPPVESLDAAAALLGAARFPVIWVGGGVIAAGAATELQNLAERIAAPVVMSDAGRGALSDRHPLALPSLAARAVLPYADVVLVAGSRFINYRAQPAVAAPHAQFIYLNLEENDSTPPREPGLLLLGDARVGFEALRASVAASRNFSGAVEACQRVRDWCERQFETIQPQRRFLTALRRAIPENGILVTELTQVGYLATVAYPVYAPGTLIAPGYQGTLGYGFPTAIGATAGNPDRVVVSINGDGGFGWNLQELATVAKYRLPLITVIFNDSAFGNVRRIQKEVFARTLGTDLCNPDFLKLGDAFGVPAVRVTTPTQLEGVIREAATSRNRGPLLVEVPVGEMPSPWHLINTIARPPQPPPPNPLDPRASD